jgi:DNA mismatch repair protein MutS2
MNDDSIHILEFDIILAKVSGFAVSDVGKECIHTLFPFTDADELKKELGRVTETKSLLEYDDPFPLYAFTDIRPYYKRIEVVGAFLEPKEFLELKSFLVITRQVKEYIAEREEKYPLLLKMASRLLPQPELEKAIDKVVDSHGEVKDKASEALAGTRKELRRVESRVRQRLEQILRTMVSKGYAQEDALTLREGRSVIPMKEIHRGRLKGIVVDHSASGATLYVEPLDVVEMNNEIRRLRAQERQEIEKILKRITDHIRERLPDISENLKIAGQLDGLSARAKYSQEVDGVAGDIADAGILELKQARHPLLLMRESREEVIPLILSFGDDVKTLVVTGPNAGGKTVALKTVGLLALMHLHGLHVPAAEGTSFPIFSEVFADIGDRQSIEQDLSTFSSHVGNIKRIVDKADEHSLILLDEIGSATDPAEGSALAEVILRKLTLRGCLTMATTHMGTLKVFAHEESCVENGSMAFDQKTLRPTYRFQMGIPGSSYAFEIAGRLGISSEILKEAKGIVGDERGELDRLILHLQDELRRTHTLLEEAEIKESRLSGLVKLYQERLDDIKKSGEEKRQKIIDEAGEILKKANATVERVVREIRENQAKRESIRAAKDALKSQKKKIEALSKEEEKDDEEFEFRPGDWVTWPGHGGKGEILSEQDGSGRVLVQWDEVKIRVSAKELKPVQGPKKVISSSGMARFSVDRQVGSEIDLRGMTADEAIETVDRYLSDAALAGLSQVGIIHGKGTGVLRREIGRHLKGHSLVKSQRWGNWNEGDTGITIVELK